MTAPPRTRAVAVGAALAALVLAGCANAAVRQRTETPQDALARVQGTAAKVIDAKSARFSMTVRTIFAGEQIPASTATTVGVYDYAAHKGQMDTSVKTAGIPFRETVRTLVIGSRVYTKLPAPPELPEGGPAIPGDHKPWIEFELPKELSGFGGLGPGVGPGPGEGAADPTEALRYLEAAASKVDLVGQEQVRGVAATRYAVTFDAANQAAQLPAQLRGFYEESGFAFARPADVWIDQQGRLRKIHYAITMKAPDLGTAAEQTAPKVTVDSTLELYDFGVEVQVTPPPASQVEVIRADQPPPDCASGQVKGGACVGVGPRHPLHEGQPGQRKLVLSCSATSRSRSSTRRILPEMVLGSSSTNSTSRGYLNGAVTRLQ
jgi:hypothetical protein